MPLLNRKLHHLTNHHHVFMDAVILRRAFPPVPNEPLSPPPVVELLECLRRHVGDANRSPELRDGGPLQWSTSYPHIRVSKRSGWSGRTQTAPQSWVRRETINRMP